MSRRQRIPSNIFYRKADPNPPMFPEPWEGDIYFNTERNQLRIYHDGAWTDASGSGGAHGLLSGLDADDHPQYAPIHVVQTGDPAPTEYQRTGQIVVRLGENPDPLLGFVQTVGGTMTGPLLLAGDPSNPLEAVSKEYVDSLAFGGGVADARYTHAQEVPSQVWIVHHGLGKMPSVSVIDGGGALVHGEVSYLDDQSLTITFDVAITGTAACN